jgi:secreted PhoX family phosphatase
LTESTRAGKNLTVHRRREFLRGGLVGATLLAFGPGFWRDALAAPATPAVGPYGPLQPPDANGLMLPKGFSSRVVAQGGLPVSGTTYPWHIFSDGAATYPTSDGGYILVSNSEVPAAGQGGASAIRFGRDGSIEDAYRILAGTSTNCAGGPTPWGTWLSCEEIDRGQVWECKPEGPASAAVVHPAMGVFQHEAAAVDPAGKRVYLTEDVSSGGFYRFMPTDYPDLSAGLLEIARVRAGGAVEWVKVPDPAATTTPTRDQVQGATRFRRGEGMWFDSGTVYVATTSDSRIHAYDTRSERIEVLYDAGALENPPLTDVDNITVSRSGDLFVCEDTGGADPFDIGLITPDRRVSRFLKVTGPQHGQGDTEASSELAGVVFDPSGRRMYFASQRAFFTGVVYEVSGPFRASAAQANPPAAGEDDSEEPQGRGRRRSAAERSRGGGGPAQQSTERSSFSGDDKELPFSGYHLAAPAAAGAASVAAGLALRRAAHRKPVADDGGEPPADAT